LRGITDGFNLGCNVPKQATSPFKPFQSHPWESCGRAREVNQKSCRLRSDPLQPRPGGTRGEVPAPPGRVTFGPTALLQAPGRYSGSRTKVLAQRRSAVVPSRLPVLAHAAAVGVRDVPPCKGQDGSPGTAASQPALPRGCGSPTLKQGPWEGDK